MNAQLQADMALVAQVQAEQAQARVESRARAQASAVTVADLIATLSAVDPTLRVHTVGCDCSGPCSGITVSDGVVYLERDDG